MRSKYMFKIMFQAMVSVLERTSLGKSRGLAALPPRQPQPYA
jgi:hypothetical protein